MSTLSRDSLGVHVCVYTIPRYCEEMREVHWDTGGVGNTSYYNHMVWPERRQKQYSHVFLCVSFFIYVHFIFWKSAFLLSNVSEKQNRKHRKKNLKVKKVSPVFTMYVYFVCLCITCVFVCLWPLWRLHRIRLETEMYQYSVFSSSFAFLGVIPLF